MAFEAASGLSSFRRLQWGWEGECGPGKKVSQPWCWCWVGSSVGVAVGEGPVSLLGTIPVKPPEGFEVRKNNRGKRKAPASPFLQRFQQHGLVQHLMLPWMNSTPLPFPPLPSLAVRLHMLLRVFYLISARFFFPSFLPCSVFLLLSVIFFFSFLLTRREIAKISPLRAAMQVTSDCSNANSF